MVEVIREYQKDAFSHLMFPSRLKPNQPIDPGHIRKRLQVILERAGCKKVRFHDLRHTFATMSLEHGMDLKTLSTIIGHVSAKTTLNIYTHITSEMQENAAASIDRGIAKTEIKEKAEAEKLKTPQKFEPQKAPRRRPGTGYMKQIKDNLWEGQYSPIYPDGKRYPRNVYAHSEEECEALLKEVIREVNTELAEARKQATAT